LAFHLGHEAADFTKILKQLKQPWGRGKELAAHTVSCPLAMELALVIPFNEEQKFQWLMTACLQSLQTTFDSIGPSGNSEFDRFNLAC